MTVVSGFIAALLLARNMLNSDVLIRN